MDEATQNLYLDYINHRGEKKTFKLDQGQVKVRKVLQQKLNTLRMQVNQARINKAYNTRNLEP
jgi:hypothetical protein